MLDAESLDADALVAHVRQHLGDVYGGRRWLLTGDVIQGAAGRHIADLGALGGSGCFVLAGCHGIGAVPDAPHAVLDVTGTDMMDGIRRSMTALEADIPVEIQARVDAWDPTGEARVIRALFASDRPVARRTVFGGRPAHWRVLEDKSTVDALWRQIGIPGAPSAVVPAVLDDLWAAHVQLDRGAGTVWSADNREGWHGGASGLRWVRSRADAEQAAEWMADHAWTVRVMPFLEGAPCSIHGIVFADHVVVLRPCEMVVLREPGTMRFSYAQAATFWDPDPADREQMRAVTRRTGEWLRDNVGYRGVFTIDGIMAAEGFRPTELNPRFGGAIGKLAGSLPELPLYLLHLALIEEGNAGSPPRDWQPQALEAVLVAAADTHRRGGAMQVLPGVKLAPRTAGLVWEDGDWRFTQDDEHHDVHVRLGPGTAGSLLMLQLTPESTPHGPLVAPRVVSALAFLDAQWSLGIGPRQAARAVR